MSLVGFKSVTSAIGASAYNNYLSAIAGYYGVSSDDVSASLEYFFSGRISIANENGESAEAVERAIKEMLSQTLGVALKYIVVNYNEFTGEATFEIAAESYADVSGAMFNLNTDQILTTLKTTLSSELAGVTLSNMDVSANIVARLKMEVDANMSQENLTVATYLAEDMLKKDGWQTDSTIFFRTSSPSLRPSVSPTTSIPSASPSITGSVAIFRLNMTVNESLTETQIDALRDTVANEYGLPSEKVDVDVVYKTVKLFFFSLFPPLSTALFLETGTLNLTIPAGVDETEFLESVKDRLAEILGVHESQIDVFVDETGDVKYTICNFVMLKEHSKSSKCISDTATAEEAAVLRNTLKEGDSKTLLGELSNLYPGLVVNEISPDDEILVDVLITADTSNASQNLANAKDDSCNTFDVLGYSCEAKSKYF